MIELEGLKEDLIGKDFTVVRVFFACLNVVYVGDTVTVVDLQSDGQDVVVLCLHRDTGVILKMSINVLYDENTFTPNGVKNTATNEGGCRIYVNNAPVGNFSNTVTNHQVSGRYQSTKLILKYFKKVLDKCFHIS